jgi:hypothetical protein
MNESEKYFKEQKRYRNMTLVQASIANKGNSIILIADRLVTASFVEGFPEYESEGNTPKIKTRGNVGIGFSGSELYADMAIDSIPSTLTDFDKIQKEISKFVKKQRETIINDKIVKLTGLPSKDFFPKSEVVPEDVREYVYGWLNEAFRFEFEGIVAGFDKNNKATICYITDDGSIESATNSGIGAIGSGAPFSQIYFDLCNYDISMPEIEGLYFAYRAKKWAEAPTGVGFKTDIFILRNNNEKPIKILDNGDLMKEIIQTYNKEKVKVKEIRKNLLNQLIRKSSGVLK